MRARHGPEAPFARLLGAGHPLRRVRRLYAVGGARGDYAADRVPCLSVHARAGRPFIALFRADRAAGAQPVLHRVGQPAAFLPLLLGNPARRPADERFFQPALRRRLPSARVFRHADCVFGRGGAVYVPRHAHGVRHGLDHFAAGQSAVGRAVHSAAGSGADFRRALSAARLRRGDCLLSLRLSG